MDLNNFALWPLGILWLFLFITLIAAPWVLIVLVPFVLFAAGPALLIYIVTSAWLGKRTAFNVKILVVDDEPMSVSPLLVALEASRIPFDLVTSGSRMLNELKTQTFDMIFVDRFMPGMNGDEALTRGDLELNLKHPVPVILYSANPDGFSLQPGKSFHIRDVWNKSFEFTEVRSRLNHLVNEIVA